MKRKLSASLLTAVLLLAAAGVAQEAKPEPTLTDVMHRSLANVERQVVELAEAMPEEHYGFAPSEGEFKGVRTFGEQVRHIAAANFLITASLMGEKPPVDVGQGDDGPEALKSKAEIMQYLKDSFAYAHKAMNTIRADNAAGPVKNPFGKGEVPRTQITVVMMEHCMNHFGQMVVYLRMNGIIPPGSRPQS